MKQSQGLSFSLSQGHEDGDAACCKRQWLYSLCQMFGHSSGAGNGYCTPFTGRSFESIQG